MSKFTNSLEFTKYFAICQGVPVHKALYSSLNILSFTEGLLGHGGLYSLQSIAAVHLFLPLCPQQSLDAPTSMM